MDNQKYKFENGKLFKSDPINNCYKFVFQSIYVTSKTSAIKAYSNRVKLNLEEC